jgi:rod shape-determining protein MreD
MEELSLYQKLESWFKSKLPFGLIIVLIILSHVPFKLGYSLDIRPFFAMGCVFYWALFRPDVLGYGSSFFAGVVEDLMGGAPFGVNSLAYLIIYAITVDQRRYLINRSFQVTWAGFSLISLVSMLIQFLFTSLIYAKLAPFSIAFINYLVLVCSYPIISFLCTKLQTSSLKDI